MPNPFGEASVSMTVSACRSKYLSVPSDETSFLTMVKARLCSGPQEYAVSFLGRSLTGADKVARRLECLVRYLTKPRKLCRLLTLSGGFMSRDC